MTYIKRGVRPQKLEALTNIMGLVRILKKKDARCPLVKNKQVREN